MKSHIENIATIIFRWLMTILTIIIPLKFSVQIGAPWINELNSDLLTIIFSNWAFPILLILIFTTAILGKIVYPSFRNKNHATNFLFIILAIGFTPSLFYSYDYNAALDFFYLLLCFGIYGQTINTWLANDNHAHRYLITSISIVAVLFILWAWIQRPLGGLAQTEIDTIQMAKEQNIEINPRILKRLSQRRAYGPFGYPNTFAAYLLLITPIFIIFTKDLCHKINQKFSISLNEKVCIFFACSLSLSAIAFSESRSAIAAIAISIIAISLKLYTNKKVKIIICASLFIALPLLLIAFSIITQRNVLGTIISRTEYWSNAIEIFINHPFIGVGWNEFYPHYMAIKDTSAEIARTPHNFILKFATQTGIIGLIASTTFFIFPFYKFFKTPLSQLNSLKFAAFAGIFAFLVHSLLDFNFLFISPFFALAAVLPIIIDEKQEKKNHNKYLSFIAITILTLLSSYYIWYCSNSYNGIKELQQNPLATKYASFVPLHYWLDNIEYLDNNPELKKQNIIVYEKCLKEAQQRSPHRASLLLKIAIHEKSQNREYQEILNAADFWSKGDAYLQEQIQNLK